MKKILAFVLAAMMLASVCTFTVAAEDEPLTIVSATIINDTQMIIKFSEPVEFVSSFFGAVRYAKPGATPQTAGAIKGVVDGTDSYLQFFGKKGEDGYVLQPTEGSDGSEYIWTMSTPTTATSTNVYSVYAKEQANLKQFADYEVFYCIEEMEYEEDGKTAKNSDIGTIYNVRSKANPEKHLSATRNGAARVWDGHYIKISVDPEYKLDPNAYYYVEKDDVRDITVQSVKVLNERQLEIKFSEPIRILGPANQPVFNGLRYVNSNFALMRDAENAVMQSIGHLEVSGDTAICTLDKGGALTSLTIAELFAMKGHEEEASVEGNEWQVAFCLEAMPDDRITDPYLDYIDNIRSTEDIYGILKGSHHGSNPNYTDLYITADMIEGVEENGSLSFLDNYVTVREELEVDSVTILNDHQIEVRFAEEIRLAGSADPFVALRYTDENHNYAVDADGNPLQWSGSVEIGEDGVTLIWTMRDKEKTIRQVLEKDGYEEYAADMLVAFIIEGMPDTSGEIASPVFAFVDNVQSAEGERLLKANKLKAANDKEREIRYFPAEELEGMDNIDEVYVPEVFKDITIESVTIINERQIELVFSEPVKIVGSASPELFSAIRYTNPSSHGVIYLNGDTKKPMQWSGTLKVKENKMTWTINAGSPSFDDLLDKKGYEDTDWLVEFCLEGKPNGTDTVIKEFLVGYIDNIQAAEGKGMLVATKPATANGVYDGWLTPDILGRENTTKPYGTVVERDVTVLSTTILNECQIQIVFSEPIQLVGDQLPFKAMRYTDSTYQVQYVTNADGKRTPMQFSGSIAVEGDTMTFTYAGSPSLAEIFAKKGYEDTDWLVAFCIEEMPDKSGDSIPTPVINYVDNIQSLDGKGMLRATKKGVTATGLYDGWLTSEFEGMENLSKKYIAGGVTELGIEKVAFLNERQIEITFDQNIRIVGSSNPFSAMRFTDANQSVQWYDTNGDDKKEAMQYSGSLAVDGNKLIWTKAAGGLSLADIIAKKGYEDTDWIVRFCIEGMPDTSGAITKGIVGVVDNIQSLDGKAMLGATKKNGDGVYDGWLILAEDIEDHDKLYEKYVPVLIRPVWPEDTREGVDVVSVKCLNESQLQIKFSEPVKFVGTAEPWCSIRYVTYGGDGRPQYGTYKRASDGKSTVMQFAGSLAINGTDTAIWTKSSGDTMYDILNMKAAEGNAKVGYDVMFNIEGKPDDTIKNNQLAYIDNIVSKDGKRMLKGQFVARDLGKNPDGSWRAAYDGYYGYIENPENAKKLWEPPYHPYVTIKEVRVLNNFQLQITFSEPVKLVGDKAPFSAIRYVDKNNPVPTLQWVNNSPMQFSGTLLTNDTEIVKWTLNSNSAKTLKDLFAYAGYEKAGYRYTFCIEGMPDGGKAIPNPVLGYIDNVQSLDGKKLLKCSYKKWDASRMIYDGYYHYDILDIEKASQSVDDAIMKFGVEVESVTITGDYSIEVKFSEPVVMIGEGTAATQYCPVLAAIRFTDVNFNVQNVDGKRLEYAGDFVIDDGTDIGYWEMRTKTTPIKALFKNPDYKDLTPAFCIEGTADTDLIPTPQVGYIDNIQSVDGTKLLVSTKNDMFGVTDAFYTTEFSEPEKDPNAPSNADVSSLVDKESMTNAEREAINALSPEEYNARLEKAATLLSSAKVGEISEANRETFEKLLSKNGITEDELKSYIVGIDEPMDVGFPLTLVYNVSEKEFDMNDHIYVYRINEDGSVEKIERVTATVSDGKIKNVKFMSDKLSDFIITNKELNTNVKPAGAGSFPWLYVGGGVGLAAIIAIILAIVFGKKKKKA